MLVFKGTGYSFITRTIKHLWVVTFFNYSFELQRTFIKILVVPRIFSIQKYLCNGDDF